MNRVKRRAHAENFKIITEVTGLRPDKPYQLYYMERLSIDMNFTLGLAKYLLKKHNPK